MNKDIALLVVSGIVSMCTTSYIVYKKLKKRTEKKNEKAQENQKEYDDESVDARLFRFKKHIIEEAINCGIQNEIPGWKKDEIPIGASIDELANAETVGWGQITVSIVRKLESEKSVGTGSETSG
ncbi:MAG: hypothetical protein DRP09_10330 [Candidatus Thorarchaeota archaeon]|nr:MAG: hypothetical protein DRP09_10330 [Candidatus Thorarchaeota archaeon]